MKGYFSELARHTGLSFASNQSTASRGFSIDPEVAARSKATATPIHVDEVTFTAPRQTPDSDFSDVSTVSNTTRVADGDTQAAIAVSPGEISTTYNESTTVSTIADDSLVRTKPDFPHKAATTPETEESPASSLEESPASSLEESRIQFADSQPEAGQRPALSAREQFFPGVKPVDRVPTVKTDPPELIERVEIVEGRFETPGHEAPRSEAHDLPVENSEARRIEVRNPDAPPPGNVNERSDAASIDNVERERIFHDQMKEVMAWVSAPPEDFENEPRPSSAMEAQSETGGPLVRERTAHAPSYQQPARAQEPEVQDLSLSIGSISIVIEEPTRSVPAALTPAPRADRSPERASPEPTRLSRYYLRNW